MGEGKGADEVPWSDKANLLPIQCELVDDQLIDVDSRDWQTAVRHLIERRPRVGRGYHGEPFTLESVLQRFRDRLEDVVSGKEDIAFIQTVGTVAREFFAEQFDDESDNPFVAPFVQDVKNIVLKEKEKVKWYACVSCNMWI